MLVVLPKDSKEANVLLRHIQRQVQCSNNNKSAALVLLSSTETNEYLLKDFHYVGEESTSFDTSDSQTLYLWKIGKFSKFRPLFGGKDTDSDDELPAQGFVKPPPSFSLDELKHMNKYAELKPAYDFLSSEGNKTYGFSVEEY